MLNGKRTDFVSHRLHNLSTEGWHLPALDHNPNAKLVAIVDTSDHPKSNLNPGLEPLHVLATKYNAKIFSSVDDMIREVGSEVDGVLIATPHATHFSVCKSVMNELKLLSMI